MKKTVLIILSLFLYVSINAQDNTQKLLNNQDFIQLLNVGVEYWESPPEDPFSVSWIKALTFNAMGRCEESNKEIEAVVTAKKMKKNPYLADLLRIQADNYAKMYQYKQAADTYKKIVDKYAKQLGGALILYQDMFRRYNALSNVAPLNVHIPRNTQIPTTQGRYGHSLVQVRSPKDSVSLIFDTGAGMSCVTQSIARRLGIRMLADSLIVGGVSNNVEYMSIGVADTLYVGDIVYTNVVFGVFEDEKLTFSEIDYAINGVLGLPEIKALSSIKINKDNSIEIFADSTTQKSNMMFSGTQQIVVQANDTLLLWLDTGSIGTVLSMNYYNKEKAAIDAVGELSTKEMGGMGGSNKFSVYTLRDFPIKIQTNTIILPEIPVFTQAISAIQYEFDGILGQDVISQYDYMVLDFKNMHFSLGNNQLHNEK
jgi:predicted aspartyl protease